MKRILLGFENTVILFIFITKIMYNVCLALREYSSVTDIRNGICKLPVVISALQIAYCYNRFAKCVLSSALCKVPIFIINLQSAYWHQNLQGTYCHQRFAKCLLLSAFCKMPCHQCQSK